MRSEINCFIIMPFAIPGVKEIIQEVGKSAGVTAFRADEKILIGTIVEEVKTAVANADFCIADVSGANANVMWEAGYAHALGKPIILISQETETLPFDVRAEATLRYDINKPETLRCALAPAVNHVLQQLRGKPRLLGEPYDELQELAMQLNRHSVYTRRHEPILPILLRAVEWEENNGHVEKWISEDAGRLMRAIAKIASQPAQGVFWWLIVYGILAYDQIERFQEQDDEGRALDGWNYNLDLIRISRRGVAFLNRLAKPF